MHTKSERQRETAQEAVKQKKQKPLKKPSNSEIRYNSHSEKKERPKKDNMMKKKYNTMLSKKTKPKNLSPHAKYNTPWISLPLYQSAAEGGGDKRAEQRSLLLCQTDPSPHVHRCNTCMREESPPFEHFNVILGARKWFASPHLSCSLEAYCCFLAPQVTCQCLQGGALLSQARSVT